MKKILLSVGLFSLVLVGRAQTVLNEVYVEPGAGKHEFFELYNSSTIGAQNVDCFTLVTYWEGSGTTKGWYVIDLPNLLVPSKGWFVGAAANPFNVQSQSGVIADFSWNDAAFLAANNGFLRSYQVNGAGTGYLAPTIPAALNDLFFKANFSGPTYVTLLFQNGVFINGFLGGGSSGTLDAALTALPDLAIDMSGGCTDFTIDFSTLGASEFVNSAPGSDNGFARSTDGKCGAWVKTSSSVNHTPGVTNGGATGAAGALTTTEVWGCGSVPRFVIFDITAITGDVTLLDDFPVEVQVYVDLDFSNTLTGLDVFIRSHFMATVVGPSDTIQITPDLLYRNFNVIVVYKTKRGCFDRVVFVPNSCGALPVSFTSFTATRSHSNVAVRWTTAWEQNNAGFAIERNDNGTWVQVAWVASQAVGGNSTSALSYSYNDLNNVKGISQYRIRQVDMDSKSKYSEVRSVRGDGQIGKIIVYPNPSNNGRINVSFDDASASRNVTVMDMSGRIIKDYKGVTNNNITIENLQPGMYTIKVSVPETGEQAVQKVVVNQR